MSATGTFSGASPHYQLDDDYRIRRWLLWQQTRIGAERSVLPSVQLLAQVLLSEEGKPTAVERHRILIDKLNAVASCEAPADTSAHTVVEIRRGGTVRPIDLCGALTAQRLIYSIPYAIPDGELRPKVAGDVPVLQTVPAMKLTEQDRALLADSVVVVGGTYRETRDWYATPVGEMPGAMVVINAVHSLGAHGPLGAPPAAVKFLIVVLLILIMTILFARLSSFLGYLVASAFVLALLVPVSFLMFRSGVWVDFALPLLVVQIHEFVAEFGAIDLRLREPTNSKLAAQQGESAESAAEPVATNDDNGAV